MAASASFSVITSCDIGPEIGRHFLGECQRSVVHLAQVEDAHAACGTETITQVSRMVDFRMLHPSETSEYSIGLSVLFGNAARDLAMLQRRVPRRVARRLHRVLVLLQPTRAAQRRLRRAGGAEWRPTRRRLG